MVMHKQENLITQRKKFADFNVEKENQKTEKEREIEIQKKRENWIKSQILEGKFFYFHRSTFNCIVIVQWLEMFEI